MVNQLEQSAREGLERAYRATIYRLFLPGSLCELKLDQRCEPLCCWLETAGADSFAILTAFNPGSAVVEPEVNADAQSRLECDLLEAGFEPYAGENEAAEGDWMPEETCFVPGISEAEAVDLAKKYGQNAIVFGASDGIPRLVWVA